MNPKAVQRIDQIIQLDTHMNYFKVGRNLSFTSVNLKIKRCLAYCLKKLTLLPGKNEQILSILLLLLETWQPTNEKLENEFIQLLENNFLSTEEGQKYCSKIYKWFMDIFKKNSEKKFLFMSRLAMLYAYFDQDADLDLLIAQQKYNYHNMNNPNWHYLLQCLTLRSIQMQRPIGFIEENSNTMNQNTMDFLNVSQGADFKPEAFDEILQKWGEANPNILKLKLTELFETENFDECYSLLVPYRNLATKSDHDLSVWVIRIWSKLQQPLELSFLKETLRYEKYNLQLLQECLLLVERPLDQIHLLLHFLEFNEGNITLWKLLKELFTNVKAQLDDPSDFTWELIFNDKDLRYSFDEAMFIRTHFVNSLKNDIQTAFQKLTANKGKAPNKLVALIEKTTLATKADILNNHLVELNSPPKTIFEQHLQPLQKQYEKAMETIRKYFQC